MDERAEERAQVTKPEDGQQHAILPWQSAWPDSAAKLRGSRRQDGGDLSDLQIMRLCFKGGPTTAASFCPPPEFHGGDSALFFRS